MPVLTFKNAKFVLEGVALAQGPQSVFWEFEGSNWATRNYEAARQYEALADEKARRVLDRLFVRKYSMPRTPLPDFLDRHQREGVRWVLTRSRSYLAHAPGAGKTCEAIVASLYVGGEGKVAFVVPPSLTVNWAREIVKFWEMLQGVSPSEREFFWPGIEVVPETARKDRAAWKAEYLIIPDSMLAKPWVLERLLKTPLRFLAVDEASRFKDPSAQRSIALFGGRFANGKSTPGLVGQATHVVLLDGSPMPNRSMELWAPTFAMCPEAIGFMSQQDFGFRYCGAKMNERGEWEFKHSSREEELRERLQKNFMHVVTEDELSHSARLRKIVVMNEDVSTPELRAWERKNFDADIAISEDASHGYLAGYRKEIGLRKVDWVADYVSEKITHSDESILLFCWHREVAQALVLRLDEFLPGLVMGGTPDNVRERAFMEFQTGKIKLIIGNIAAMGRGHNLQRADRIVFGEYSWTDELNKQCEKRASRRGRKQDLPVRCDYIVAPGTLDEVMLRSLFTKAERVKKVIG